MAELNSKAQKVFALKYSTGKTKTWKDKCRKIADYIASAEQNFGKTPEEIQQIADKFYNYLHDLYILPGGRIIANADTGIRNLANCFVLDIQDSRQSIYQTLKDAAEVFADGGGLGYNFSHIRETGADIRTTGGQASGPLSFMTLFDQTGEVISQASRRGAQLATLNVDHPDSINFIDFKSTLNSRNQRLMQEYDRNLHVVNGYLNGTKYADVLKKTLLDDQLTHFNISVMINDRFMECVKRDYNWNLVSPFDGKIKKSLKARELLHKIAERIHESGDPGILNSTRINQDNLVPYIGMIEATNPCFHPDTWIETVNGRIKIKDISEPTLVYSVNKNGELVLRKCSPSWVSRKNAQTIKLKFNNNKELILTPDHKVLTHKRGWINAKDLIIGERIVALCRARRGTRYSGIKLSTENNRAYRMEHKWIYESVYGSVDNKNDVHHIDEDGYNNKIENLELLNHSEHSTQTRYSCKNDHQVKDNKGRFISNNSNYKKPVVQMPCELRSSFTHQPRVVEISEGPITDVYDISVEETNNLVANYIVAHNCGEVPLLSGESCILTSINLHQVYDKHHHCIDYDLLKDIIKTSIRFLDNVTEISQAPIDKINTMTKGLRRISLGVLGFADLLVDLDVPYDSQDAVDLSRDLSWFIAFHGWETSFELAKERGSFPFYQKDQCNFHVIQKVLYDDRRGQSTIPFEELKEVGVRNVAVTGLPPTGSIAIIGGVNSSIEPFFLLCYRRNITEGIGNIAKDYLIEINPALESKLRACGYNRENIDRIMEYVLTTGSLEGCDLVPQNIRIIFKTANEIHWKWHIDIQAAWNEYVSNAISKTINVPKDCSIEEIYQILLYAYEKKLKGVTIFRDQSKSFQILERPNSANQDQVSG